MSHFSQMKTKIKNVNMAKRVAKQFGWSMEKVGHYKDHFGNELNNCHVVTGDDRAKLLIASNGDVIVDPYYMGHDYEKFLQEYATEYIREQAVMEGAQFIDKGMVKGERIIEVEYV